MEVTELAARPRHPLGLPAAAFLRDFWQKRPLLVRGAFPELARLLDRRALLAAARRGESPARMVWRDGPRGPFRLRHGPFGRGPFPAPPGARWTVLVNDLDKRDPDRFAPFLAAFRFLPAWRIDDLMVSYAVPGGSVGAHVDHYDVFLVQGRGRREWRLDLRSGGWRPRARSELRLVSGFRATWRALLEPGDLLYLPPGVPHHGIARSECLTFSLGMRSPSLGELFGALADALLERDPPVLLSDPDLGLRPGYGELAATDRRRIAAALSGPVADEAWFTETIARFLSTWRGAAAPEPKRPRIDPEAVFAAGRRLRRDPWVRALWWRHGKRVRLAIGGQVFATTRRLAELLVLPNAFGRAELPDPSAEEREVLQGLAARHLLRVAPPAPAMR